MADVSVTFRKSIFIAGTPYVAGSTYSIDEALISQFPRDTIVPAAEPDPKNDSRTVDEKIADALEDFDGGITSITGTANQVIVTNGDGAAGNPTLSLPQSIATTSTPQFARIGIGKAADGTYLLNLNGALVHGTSTGVGIGTTSPAARLDLGASTGVVQYIYKDSYANAGLGINLSGGSCELSLFAGATGDDAGRISFGRRRVDTGTYTERMVIDAASGAVKLNAYGAGTLVTDSSGNVTASSDASLKTVTGSFTRGLADVLKLTPRTYHWNRESGMNTEDVNVGFIAQDVQDAIPEAVGTMKTVDTEEDDGTGKKVRKSKREAAEFLTLSDRPIIAALVNAVKELKAENDTLRARVSALENGKAAK